MGNFIDSNNVNLPFVDRVPDSFNFIIHTQTDIFLFNFEDIFSRFIKGTKLVIIV